MDILFNKLEYTQIIQIIQEYCKTYLGKKICKSLSPNFQFEKVNVLLSETDQAICFLFQKGLPPFSILDENLEHTLKMLESNQTLSIKALFNVAHLLKTSAELYEYFYKDSSIDCYPYLEDYFSLLYKNNNIQKNILDKLLDESTVADNASAKLSSLRKNRKSIENQVKDKLNSYIHSNTYAKYLMEPIITIRNNRYVIPVKEEYRDKIKGFIHDTSGSGSTLYIEPMAIFELNNQINHISVEEGVEIEKILQILSSSLFPYVQELKQTLNTIATLDLIFAKAQYGKNHDAIIPKLNKQKIIDFHRAKHPLIPKDKVVPIDISIGINYNCLLITGPNTGGKTVALKTMGLLLLMAYSGIPIPCHEKTNICVFSKIFVDIGDEQSIEQSLSTFSAHILNIVSITNDVNNNSFVLLDELGSGTDPVEGSALAISILNDLKEKGALVCCTTHYPELKEFALVTDGFENASFEFDLENLKPTYHLLMGIPGKSNAFEISKRLGLNSNILKNATSLLTQDTVSFEELLKNIYDDKLLIEKEKEEIQKNSNQIVILRQQLEKAQSELAEKRKNLLEKAKSEARDILLEAKEEASETIRLLNQEHIDIKQANQTRNKLNEKIKSLNPTDELLESSNDQKAIDAKDIKPGLQVWISTLNTSGNILSSHINKSGEILVQVGLAKMNLKLDNLSLMPSQNIKKSKSNGAIHTTVSSKAQIVSSEINVIGQNVEEAIYIIDKYIDNCVIAHLSPIRIVHGKGTGKLREGIHQYLKKNPNVKSFRLGTFGEGEMGVTVVELVIN